MSDVIRDPEFTVFLWAIVIAVLSYAIAGDLRERWERRRQARLADAQDQDHGVEVAVVRLSDSEDGAR